MTDQFALVRQLSRTSSVDHVLDPGFRPGTPTKRLRVLLLTEGTYPYVIGGVSTWCDQLLRNLDEIDWLVLPIVAGNLRGSLSISSPRTPD